LGVSLNAEVAIDAEQFFNFFRNKTLCFFPDLGFRMLQMLRKSLQERACASCASGASEIKEALLQDMQLAAGYFKSLPPPG